MLSQHYTDLLSTIKHLVQNARHRIAQNVNSELIHTYWQVGKAIVAKETNDNFDEKSSRILLIELSKSLTKEVGSGFARSNLFYIKQLYVFYKNGLTLSDHLNWSHIVELLKIEDNLERYFYEKQCVLENWSVRELRQQKATLLFHRFAVSKNAEGILKLAKLISKIIYFSKKYAFY